VIDRFISFAYEHPWFVSGFVGAILLALVVLGYIGLLDRRDAQSKSIPTIGREISVPKAQVISRDSNSKHNGEIIVVDFTSKERR
jgi:hypothetical protein